jgi:hypothetical protein
MKSSRKFAIAMMTLATWFGFASTSTYAQTTANGPYYATPSWDQQLPAATRFIVLANWGSAAVLDRETGLVWEKVPIASTFTWFNASSHCLNQNTGGRTGWRLPAVPELMSLVDQTQSNSLPSGHPFTVQSVQGSFYWSATTFGFTDAAWAVDFSFFGVLTSFRRSENFPLAWCVRGGPGGENQ